MNLFSDCFGISMRAQDLLGPEEDLKWHKGTCLSCKLKRGRRRPAVTFVPDFAVCDNHMNPVIIVEVSASQTKPDAEAKIRDRMARCASIVGGIIFNFIEAPRYTGPTRDATPEDKLEPDEFLSEVAGQTATGPIVLKGHKWCGEMTYEVDVHRAGVEEKTSKVSEVVQPNFSVNHPCDVDDSP